MHVPVLFINYVTFLINVKIHFSKRSHICRDTFLIQFIGTKFKTFTCLLLYMNNYLVIHLYVYWVWLQWWVCVYWTLNLQHLPRPLWPHVSGCQCLGPLGHKYPWSACTPTTAEQIYYTLLTTLGLAVWVTWHSIFVQEGDIYWLLM